jgi:hypothetical protein
MTRYVILHKLSRGFKEWEYSSNYGETIPAMNAEFNDWYHENIDQIKAVHKQKMVESLRIMIAFEFHNAEDALLCMLTFS